MSNLNNINFTQNLNNINFNETQNLTRFYSIINQMSFNLSFYSIIKYLSPSRDLIPIRFNFQECTINKNIIRKLIEMHKQFSDTEFVIVLNKCNFINAMDVETETLEDDAYQNPTFKIKIINNGEILFTTIKMLDYFKNIYYTFTISEISIFLTIINNCINNGNNNIEIQYESVVANMFNDETESEEFKKQIIIFLNLQDANRSIKFDCYRDLDDVVYLLISLLDTINNRKKLSCIDDIKLTKKVKKLFRNTTNINKNASEIKINNDNFVRLYQLFTKRYQDSLFMDYKLEPDKVKRAELYIKSIIKLIYNEQSNRQSNRQSTLETFMKYLIFTAYNFKSRISDSSFPREYNFVSYHGEIRKDMKKVPANCVLVFLSPFNTLLLLAQGNKDIINLLKSRQWTDEYYKNPLCYGKNTLNFLFTNSEIYLPGQYYPNMDLSMEENDKILFANTMGIYQSKNEYLQKVEKLHDNYFESTLSDIIDKYKFEGFVFIQSCRTADRLLRRSDTLTTDFYRLTHLMRILNKSIWFEDDNNAYEKCDEILKMPKGIKTRNYCKINKLVVTDEQTLKKLENVRKNANYSLSTRCSNLQRLGFSQNLIKILNTLDQDNLASTYEAISSELRTYETNKLALLKFNINNALKSVGKAKDYIKYLKKIIDIDILLSFFIYWQILLDNNEFEDFIDLRLLEIGYISQLFFGGCKLTTSLLEKLLGFLQNKAYSQYIEIFLQNNEITNIPLELLSWEYFEIIYVEIKGNNLSFEIVDSSKYLDKTNIDDKKKLPKELNINVYETLKKYYALKKLEDNAITLENTLFTELEQKEQQVYEKPTPFNNLTNTFMTTNGGFFSKNGIINRRMMTSKLNMKRKNKLTKLLKYSNRK